MMTPTLVRDKHEVFTTIVVDDETTIRFSVHAKDGYKWYKEIAVFKNNKFFCTGSTEYYAHYNKVLNDYEDMWLDGEERGVL